MTGKLTQGFYFEVTPLAAGVARLAKPVEFCLGSADKLAASENATASCDQSESASREAVQGGQKFIAFGVRTEPVQAQLNGSGEAGGLVQLMNG